MSSSIKFLLNSRFYTEHSIQKAFEDFNKVCKGRISRKITNKRGKDKENVHFEIELVPKRKIDEPLKEEFCNYVLGIMQNKE